MSSKQEMSKSSRTYLMMSDWKAGGAADGGFWDSDLIFEVGGSGGGGGTLAVEGQVLRWGKLPESSEKQEKIVNKFRF